MKSYHEFFLKEYLRRRNLNSKYSQRNFAKDLSIGYELLCKILNGERGISWQRAFQLAGKLGLSTKEAKEFRFLVSAQSGRSHFERNLAKQWLRHKSTKVEDQNYKKLKP